GQSGRRRAALTAAARPRQRAGPLRVHPGEVDPAGETAAAPRPRAAGRSGRVRIAIPVVCSDADTVGEFVSGVWKPRIRLASTPHLAQLPAKRPTARIRPQYRLLSQGRSEDQESIGLEPRPGTPVSVDPTAGRAPTRCLFGGSRPGRRPCAVIM